MLVALVLAGCGSSESGAPVTGVTTSDDDGYHGVLLDEPYAVPGLTLTDTDGEPFDLAAQEKRTLVFFGYTNCPDICQVVMSTIVSALAKLSPEEQRQLQVAFVTTDPARDTRSALRTYLDRFDPDYVGLTGPIERIDAAGEADGHLHQEGPEARRAAATRSTTPPSSWRSTTAPATSSGPAPPRPPTWPRTSRRSWRHTDDPTPDRPVDPRAPPRASGTSDRSRSAPTRSRSSSASSPPSGRARRRWVARGGTRGQIGDLALWAVPAGLIGARLWHVATDYQLYFGEGDGDPVDALKIWHGGLGIWGAITGGLLGAWFYCRRHGILLRPLADALAPSLLLAQIIGRFGNYFNQELFGRPTDLPWALEIDAAHRPVGYEQFTTFHPTFLYEALWNLAAIGVLLWADRRFRLGYGRVFALYVMLYTLGRGWIEDLRIDPVELQDVGGLRFNVWTSIVLFVLAAAYFVVADPAPPPSGQPRALAVRRPRSPRQTPKTAPRTSDGTDTVRSEERTPIFPARTLPATASPRASEIFVS